MNWFKKMFVPAPTPLTWTGGAGESPLPGSECWGCGGSVGKGCPSGLCPVTPERLRDVMTRLSVSSDWEGRFKRALEKAREENSRLREEVSRLREMLRGVRAPEDDLLSESQTRPLPAARGDLDRAVTTRIRPKRRQQ